MSQLGTSFLLSLRVGFFLALRQIRRGSLWTNVLIVSVMMFTFLNLVVVSGILVGLIEGIVQSVKTHYTGDIIVSNLPRHSFIEQSTQVINTIRGVPGVVALSPRYLESGTLKGDYKSIRKPRELEQTVGAIIAGVNPEEENKVTNIESLLIKGSYLESGDFDKVLLGALLLEEYAGFESEAFPVLKNVDVGSKILLTVGGKTREVTIKGILKSKVDEIDRRVFLTDAQMRQLLDRFDYNVDEIAVTIKPDADPNLLRDIIKSSGVEAYAKVQTQEDAEPKFVKDIKNTFALLGNVISSIGLIVASITIFIVIFINAITRRKFIGIMKGIGIEGRAIEAAYVFQSIFYAFCGTILGLMLVFFFLKPYFAENPIDFPFSDGILVATFSGTLIRILVLFIATLVAGYVPARIVVKQNTLDAILGR